MNESNVYILGVTSDAMTEYHSKIANNVNQTKERYAVYRSIFPYN
jgi:hypothetical protein